MQVCLHKLMQDLEGSAQNAVMMSVRSLRSETDEKVGGPFFSAESIEQAADVAGNTPFPHLFHTTCQLTKH